MGDALPIDSTATAAPQQPENTTFLIDSQGRNISYLRLAITDRCNLRCQYCMPEEGISSVDHLSTLSYEELEFLVSMFLRLGIRKVRITGGEPFVRKGCMDFLRRLKEHKGVPQLFLTTNGVETWRHMTELRSIGISGINLSLDALNRDRFQQITRRDSFDAAIRTFELALEFGIPLKINSVVLEDTTDDEIRQLGELSKNNPISVRFIEKMPFSGKNQRAADSGQALLVRLHRIFPEMAETQASGIATARLFSHPGFTGTIGIIEGSSRNFCATCNKVRITPTGMLKACLYDNGILDLRSLIRDGITAAELAERVISAVGKRLADGRLTESACSQSIQPSMASIGG